MKNFSFLLFTTLSYLPSALSHATPYDNGGNLQIQWTSSPRYSDVLEYQFLGDSRWEVLPRPYGHSENPAVCRVSIPSVVGGMLFRVRRDWGTPAPIDLVWEYGPTPSVREFIVYELTETDGVESSSEVGRTPETGARKFTLTVDGLPHRYVVTASNGFSESDYSNAADAPQIIKPVDLQISF